MNIPSFLSHYEDALARRFQKAFREALKTLNEVRRQYISESLSRINVNYSDPIAGDAVGHETYEDVAAENIRRIFDVSLPIMESQGLRSALVDFLCRVDRDRQFWSALFASNSTESIRTVFFHCAWQAALLKPHSNNPLPNEVGILLVVSRTVGLIGWWLSEPDPLPIEQVAELLDEVVVSPLVMIDIEG